MGKDKLSYLVHLREPTSVSVLPKLAGYMSYYGDTAITFTLFYHLVRRASADQIIKALVQSKSSSPSLFGKPCLWPSQQGNLPRMILTSRVVVRLLAKSE